MNKVKQKELEDLQAFLKSHQEADAELQLKKVIDNEDLTPELMRQRSKQQMTCLQAKMTNDKIKIKRHTLKDEIFGNREFTNRVEGQLIEQLRQVTFKIKVMDYIARKAFSVTAEFNLER